MNGRINSVAALATKAVQVLAPNNVQLSEHEFQRSPKEEQDAAREAAKLVKPGNSYNLVDV
ncbi:hypothetical protein CCR75_004511 [Bremia lactucae]|uniref:Uncharacterized protein n=1 Tax=Bremia lactucae TaxID=4779 RepID=A0A976FKM4_BRELC|nr:hypothetical protein CCR75_004511 [Bremia lactucae]